MLEKIKQRLISLCIKIITFDYFVIKHLVKKWIPKRKIKVLDLGCGDGYFADYFSRHGYLGIDIDPASISLAKEAHPKYSFDAGDILVFKSQVRFDLVLVIGVLHHLNDSQLKKSLDVIKRVLKMKGRAIIIEAIPPISRLNFIGKLLRNLDQGHYVRYLEDYEKEIEKKFDIIYSEEVFGGLLDYGIIIASC